MSQRMDHFWLFPFFLMTFEGVIGVTVKIMLLQFNNLIVVIGCLHARVQLHSCIQECQNAEAHTLLSKDRSHLLVYVTAENPALLTNASWPFLPAFLNCKTRDNICFCFFSDFRGWTRITRIWRIWLRHAAGRVFSCWPPDQSQHWLTSWRLLMLISTNLPASQQYKVPVSFRTPIDSLNATELHRTKISTIPFTRPLRFWTVHEPYQNAKKSVHHMNNRCCHRMGVEIVRAFAKRKSSCAFSIQSPTTKTFAFLSNLARLLRHLRIPFPLSTGSESIVWCSLVGQVRVFRFCKNLSQQFAFNCASNIFLHLRYDMGPGAVCEVLTKISLIQAIRYLMLWINSGDWENIICKLDLGKVLPGHHHPIHPTAIYTSCIATPIPRSGCSQNFDLLSPRSRGMCHQLGRWQDDARTWVILDTHQQFTDWWTAFKSWTVEYIHVFQLLNILWQVLVARTWPALWRHGIWWKCVFALKCACCRLGSGRPSGLLYGHFFPHPSCFGNRGRRDSKQVLVLQWEPRMIHCGVIV